MKLTNVKIYLEEEKLSVVCDLLIQETEDTHTHPDSPITLTVKEIEVTKIHSVDYVAMDCVDIDLTQRFKKDTQLTRKLENALIEEVEYKNLSELNAA
jgi:hypothetical protein